MRLLLANLLGLVLLFATTAGQSAELDPKRTLHLSGVITRQTLAPLAKKLDELIAATDKDTSPVTLVIDSPGGEVVSGMSFVNKMLALKSFGVDINCYVQDIAASMAFQILTQCTNRYSLNTSFLLWHGVRVSISAPITEEVATALAEDLRHINQLILMQLHAVIGLSNAATDHHFVRETLWSGCELHTMDQKFITSAATFPEVNRVLRKEGVTRSGKELFSFFNVRGATMIYSIWKPFEFVLLGTIAPTPTNGGTTK